MLGTRALIEQTVRSMLLEQERGVQLRSAAPVAGLLFEGGGGSKQLTGEPRQGWLGRGQGADGRGCALSKAVAFTNVLVAEVRHAAPPQPRPPSHAPPGLLLILHASRRPTLQA